MNAASDSFGNFAKFVPPLVANGRVYVATWSKQVAVYGLTDTMALTGVSPHDGPITGGPATLTGRNFVTGATVSFGGETAVVTSVSAARIGVITPAHDLGRVNVVVTNPDGQSSTLTDGFTYKKGGPLGGPLDPPHPIRPQDEPGERHTHE